MSKINRRQMLTGLAGAAVVVAVPQVVKASKKKLPCGLKELALPVVKFDEKGHVNVNELFGDAPFQRTEHPWFVIKSRVIKAFLPEETPVLESQYAGIVYFHGEVEIKHELTIFNIFGKEKDYTKREYWSFDDLVYIRSLPSSIITKIPIQQSYTKAFSLTLDAKMALLQEEAEIKRSAS